jgi:hypothetical protein
MKWMAIGVLAASVVLSAAGKVPRARDGHPDLSGNWTYATLTTLERPKEFGAKAFLTAEEAAAFEKKTLTVQDRDRRDGEGPDGRRSRVRSGVVGIRIEDCRHEADIADYRSRRRPHPRAHT